MLGHPMEFDVEGLLGHVLRDESGQEILNDFFGHSGEDVKRRDVEDFRPAIVGVRLVHKQSVVIPTSS